jgi:uridine kinase
MGIISITYLWQKFKNNFFFYLCRKKPFVIGIAGDSGAGKDTLSNALEGLFGEYSVTKISGDNYHLYSRGEPVWDLITHLNPKANDLKKSSSDLATLISRKNIYSKIYNHITGELTQQIEIKSNNFIIKSGLHALYSPILRDLYDLRIYLDTDENLRRYFKFKRDIQDRGYTFNQLIKIFNKRKPDSIKFIVPQSRFADLIFSLKPSKSKKYPLLLTNKLPPLKLTIKSKGVIYDLMLLNNLKKIPTLRVVKIPSKNYNTLIIEGNVNSKDIKDLIKNTFPKMLKFLVHEPIYKNGQVGLMQFFTLFHINQKFRIFNND